jgi:uncharacterized phage-associated protein
MKTYDSVLFAKYLLGLAHSRKVALNNTQLQKLLYIVYGFYLGKKGGHIVLNENPRTWPYGPVFPRVHKEVDTTWVPNLDSDEFAEIKEDLELRETLALFIDKFGKLPATKLSSWSHMEGGPWDKTVKEFGKWNTPIPSEYIQSYFSQLQFA